MARNEKLTSKMWPATIYYLTNAILLFASFSRICIVMLVPRNRNKMECVFNTKERVETEVSNIVESSD